MGKGKHLPAKREKRPPELLPAEREQLQMFGGKILSALMELKEGNQITNLELGVKGSILLIALAENTSTSNRLRALEDISRQEGLLNNKLIRGRIFKAKDKTEAELWWTVLKETDPEAAGYENFDDFQKGDAKKRKSARSGDDGEKMPAQFVD